jgi:hypothetical protein
MSESTNQLEKEANELLGFEDVPDQGICKKYLEINSNCVGCVYFERCEEVSGIMSSVVTGVSISLDKIKDIDRIGK